MAELTGPIPNPFRAFNTMTYSMSLYLQDPKEYASMMATGKKDVSKLELLVQSGGISSDTTKTGGNFGATRNKFFTRDFYLDDIQLSSYIAGTSTGGPQNSFEMNFTVTEPMGLTFMDRLYNAATDFAERKGYQNFNPINQIYLAVIRFYGYDENGKQVINGKFNDGSDDQSYIEKWIPIMIRSVQFRVETAKVVYSCECVCPQTQVGHGQVHGTIPFDIALQGETLKDLLDGTVKRTLAGGVVTTGLMSALNSHQLKLAADNKYQFADKYAIEFEAGAGIEDETVTALGTSVVMKSGTASGANPAAESKMKSGSAKNVKSVQTTATNAGMKIVKFIDLAIRNSSFMTKQYKKMNEANKDKTTKFRTPKPFKWFKIRPRIEIIDFDSKRQAWAYKITYVVTLYNVSTVNTNDFESADCFKTHKEYDFWFTGKNTEVLDFKQDYNSFYYTTFSDKHKENPNENPEAQTNLRAMRTYRANSIESNAGSENKENEQAANAASILYAPQDIANVSIDIVGDPDWLGQSELFYAATPEPKDPVLDDGSINYDTAEVFFSVNFNTVVDYDLDTGIADVTQKNVSKNLNGSEPGGVSQYSFVYRANTIVSQFAGGQFVQKLEGTLVFIPERCITGQAPEDKG